MFLDSNFFSEHNVNLAIDRIIFFSVIYIFACFFDKILVYFWLFIIFVLALIIKISFHMNAATLAKLCWYYISLGVLGLFSSFIIKEPDVDSLPWLFKFIVAIFDSFGKCIKDIFLAQNQLSLYMFIFMFISTLYSCLVFTNIRSHMIIWGWLIGIFIGFCLYIFLSK